MRGARGLAWFVAGTLVLVVAALMGGSQATAKPTVGVANSETYEDASGDVVAAPDIATVVVSSDDQRLVSFAIRFANRSGLGPTEQAEVYLDTDQDLGTGSPAGWEYLIAIKQGSAVRARWNPDAKAFYSIGSTHTLTSGWSGSTLTIRINTEELDSTRGFRFRVVGAVNPADPNAAWDVAPDREEPDWIYSLNLPPVLRVAGLGCKPEPAVKGKLMTGQAWAELSYGRPAPLPLSAKIKWTATIGRIRLKPLTTRTFDLLYTSGGVTTGRTQLWSTWKLPRYVNAKSVRISLTITANKVTVTKTHVHRVR